MYYYVKFYLKGKPKFGKWEFAESRYEAIEQAKRIVLFNRYGFDFDDAKIEKEEY